MKKFEFKELVCERIVLGPMEVNTYLIYGKEGKAGLVIDPAYESPTLLARIKELELDSIEIFLTHGHVDHIAGVDFLRDALNCPVSISNEDKIMLSDPTLNLSAFLGDEISVAGPEKIVKSGDKISVGNAKGEFVAIPGHTPGGLALVFEEAIFSGDTLFNGSIGRSDFPGGDGRLLIRSIEDNLLALSDRLVFPGHGPETSINSEKSENPFFS